VRLYCDYPEKKQMPKFMSIFLLGNEMVSETSA